MCQAKPIARLVIGAILFAFISVSFAAEAPLAQREWKVDGVDRQALVYVPAGATKSETPLVFAFHGHGGTARTASNSLAIHKHWPEALVVYMQGLPTPGKLTDPEGKRNGWQNATGAMQDRDLKFFDEVLATLKKEYKVDEKRIFCTGHSNGGGFTYLLWAARGDVFAAVAPSAAATRQFALLKPKPAMHLGNENDELVKFEWQKRMMDEVRRINGCEGEGKPWAKSGNLVGTIYESKTGTPFVTVISPGTHKFPAEAPELIVRFFKENGRK